MNKEVENREENEACFWDDHRDNVHQTGVEPMDSNYDSTYIYFPGKEIYQHENLLVYQGNHLPHWELNFIAYHVCFRLVDAIPTSQKMQWLEERKQFLEKFSNEHQNPTDDEMKRFQYLYSEKVEKYLDNGYGSCILRKPDVATIVRNSLEFYEGKKYLLHAWCIMPNHVHVVLQVLGTYALSEILHGWKSFTSHSINNLLSRQGQLWQDDSYNHIIRTLKEFHFQVRYVWSNPDNACLREWKWRWKRMETNDNVSPCSDGV